MTMENQPFEDVSPMKMVSFRGGGGTHTAIFLCHAGGSVLLTAGPNKSTPTSRKTPPPQSTGLGWELKHHQSSLLKKCAKVIVLKECIYIYP